MVHAATEALAQESVWYEKLRYEDAERQLFEQIAKGSSGSTSTTVVAEIMKAREQIKNSIAAVDTLPSLGVRAVSPEVTNRLQQLEKENSELKKVTDELRALVLSLDSRVKSLEGSKPTATATIPAPSKPAAPVESKEEEEDDDVDLFGSDEEDEEAEKIKQERIDAYAAKKSKKPVLIAKSNIILDIKPWDDETDMAEIERKVREIVADGLLWGTAKLVPLAYGIKKLQISTVVEDDKISVDWLTETIQELEDLVQSVDIAAFNKI
jgi:elongation factor 1-delta